MSRKKKQATASREGPPEGFRRWWEPTETVEPSGAHTGGHPDALRIWARKDPGRWNRRLFGFTSDIAWMDQHYQDEYFAWVQAGKPTGEPFVSIAATLERHSEWASGVKATIAQIGKPMPKVTPKELNAERRRLALPHKMTEPIDEDNDAIDFDHRNNEGEA